MQTSSPAALRAPLRTPSSVIHIFNTICSGVLPSRFMAFLSAPWLSSSLQILDDPCEAAQ